MYFEEREHHQLHKVIKYSKKHVNNFQVRNSNKTQTPTKKENTCPAEYILVK